MFLRRKIRAESHYIYKKSHIIVKKFELVIELCSPYFLAKTVNLT